jgi:DNA-binding NtrC family response regulator
MASVLLVDDDPDVLDAFAAVIAGGGHTVERASGGLLALELLDEGKPIDLLLTDVVMPGVHGFSLARMARLRRKELRVLYISGFADLETVMQDGGPRLGKLLTKPIMPDELRRAVDEALDGEPFEGTWLI